MSYIIYILSLIIAASCYLDTYSMENKSYDQQMAQLIRDETVFFDYQTLNKLTLVSMGMRTVIFSKHLIERRKEMFTDLLSSKFPKLSINNLVWNELGACGWVQNICGVCLAEDQCSCSERTVFPGMLCRAQLGAGQSLEVYKAYIPSYRVEKYRKVYESARKYKIIKCETNIHIPVLPLAVDHFRTNNSIDLPYFDPANNLCVLTGSFITDRLPINEISLSGYNRFIQRTCAVKIGNSILREKELQYLKEFPHFMVQYNHQRSIRSQEIQRTKDLLLYTFVPQDEHGDPLNEELQMVLPEMICTGRNVRQADSRVPPMLLFNALCAKLGGNEYIGEQYLKLYDLVCSEKHRYGDDQDLYFAPIGGVASWRYGDFHLEFTRSNIHKQCLEQFVDIKSIRDFIPLKMLTIDDSHFIEIKKNGVGHDIGVWTFEENSSKKWKWRGSEDYHLLSDYGGNITHVVRSGKALLLTEEYTAKNGRVAEINHSLNVSSGEIYTYQKFDTTIEDHSGQSNESDCKQPPIDAIVNRETCIDQNIASIEDLGGQSNELDCEQPAIDVIVDRETCIDQNIAPIEDHGDQSNEPDCKQSAVDVLANITASQKYAIIPTKIKSLCFYTYAYVQNCMNTLYIGIKSVMQKLFDNYLCGF